MSAQPPRPLLILSLEGLATSALSCYGSSWNATPTIDRLAAGGTLWDRWITHDDSPLEPVRDALLHASGWVPSWKQHGTIELITDVSEIAQLAESFDWVEHVQPSWDSSNGATDDPDQGIATDIDKTHLAGLMAEVIDRDLQNDGDWSLMWLHTAVLGQCWDAPRSLFPSDEDDLADDFYDDAIGDIEVGSERSDVYRSGVTGSHSTDQSSVLLDPADLSDQATPLDTAGSTPPHLKLTTGQIEETPDLIRDWMRVYGCQVRLLDILIDVLQQSLLRDDVQIMILGTSGMSLGQNGWVGHQAGPLRSHDVRLPIVIGNGLSIRMPCVTDDRLVSRLLQQMVTGDLNSLQPGQWARDDQSISVQTASCRTIQSSTTEEWFYVQDADSVQNLFLKPDDQEDFNNVAGLRPDVVASLSGDSESDGPEP